MNNKHFSYNYLYYQYKNIGGELNKNKFKIFFDMIIFGYEPRISIKERIRFIKI